MNYKEMPTTDLREIVAAHKERIAKMDAALYSPTTYVSDKEIEKLMEERRSLSAELGEIEEILIRRRRNEINFNWKLSKTGLYMDNHDALDKLFNNKTIIIRGVII